MTPSHIAASLLVWRHEGNWSDLAAVVAGAVVPDATMFLFYGYQKIVGTTEESIWNERYFLDHWQYLFDVFNSFPIALVLLLGAWRFECRWLQLLLVSAMLHMIFDLPLHHDDGHRHFLPLTNWRFESPISYWDPKHFGWIVAPVELLGSISALIFVSRSGATPPRRAAQVMLGIVVVLLLTFAVATSFFGGP